MLNIPVGAETRAETRAEVECSEHTNRKKQGANTMARLSVVIFVVSGFCRACNSIFTVVDRLSAIHSQWECGSTMLTRKAQRCLSTSWFGVGKRGSSCMTLPAGRSSNEGSVVEADAMASACIIWPCIFEFKQTISQNVGEWARTSS